LLEIGHSASTLLQGDVAFLIISSDSQVSFYNESDKLKDQPIDASPPHNSGFGLLQEDYVFLNNSSDSLRSCYYETDRPEGQPIDVSTPHKAIGFFPTFFGGGHPLSPIVHMPDMYSKGTK